MRLTLLDTSLTPLPDVAGFLLDPSPVAFVSCRALHGLDLVFSSPRPVSSLALVFLAQVSTEVWNSWLRSPRLPPPGSVYVTAGASGAALAATETRTPLAAHPPALPLDATRIDLHMPPQTLSSLRILFPPGPFALAKILLDPPPPLQSQPLLPVPPLDPPSLLPLRPLRGEGDPVLQHMTRLPTPALADFWQVAHPYRGAALLGPLSVDTLPLASQNWDGSLVFRAPIAHPNTAPPPGDRILLSLHLGAPPLRLVSQTLSGGYLPVGEVTLSTPDFVCQTRAFVDEHAVLHLTLRLLSPDPAHPRNGSQDLVLYAACARRQVSQNDRALHAELHTPLHIQRDGDVLAFAHTPDPQACRLTLTLDADTPTTLRIPLSDSPPRLTTAIALDRLVTRAQAFLQGGSSLQFPDAAFQTAWQALLLQTPHFQRQDTVLYGRFPGVYEDALFGVEEGWNIVSLAQLGHGTRAAAALAATFLAPAFLQKEGPHHQYRTGLALTYALDVALLAPSPSAVLTPHWPVLRENAQWIVAAVTSTRQLDNGQRPAHFGLLPRHIYGGDLRELAYSLYATSACWRGLRDASRIAALLGHTQDERHFAQQAQHLRSDLVACAIAIFRHKGQPPYLPFSTTEDGPTPSSGDYYQLFASLILETAVFGWNGPHAHAITRYLHDTGRQLCGLPRFDVWFGRPGLDAEYARGTQLAAFHRREFRRFYLGVLAHLALAFDPHTFASPETAVLRQSPAEQLDRLHALRSQACRVDSDPCSAGSGVMLQYLRALLACEQRDEDDLPTGRWLLAAPAPAHWFAPGTSFGCQRLPTPSGALSYTCLSTPDEISYHIETQRPIPCELFLPTPSPTPRSELVVAHGDRVFRFPRNPSA